VQSCKTVISVFKLVALNKCDLSPSFTLIATYLWPARPKLVAISNELTQTCPLGVVGGATRQPVTSEEMLISGPMLEFNLKTFFKICRWRRGRYWPRVPDPEPVLLMLQFTRGRCSPTWWAAWPGSAWTRCAGWTSACPSSGSFSSRRVRSSVGTDRFMERSGKRQFFLYLSLNKLKTPPLCFFYTPFYLFFLCPAGVTAHSGFLRSSSCTSVSLASTCSSASASRVGAPGEKSGRGGTNV